MENIKALLYCCKQPHKLFNTDKGFVLSDFELGDAYKDKILLNGKIVAECDYEVEEIYERVSLNDSWFNDLHHTKTMRINELLKKSCLKVEEMNKYFDYPKNTLDKVGYAIHIKNLKERVMELSDCYKEEKIRNALYSSFITKKPITKAPQNMCRVWIYENGKWIMYILISVRPKWLFLELNGEKEIEIRKRILKGMIE